MSERLSGVLRGAAVAASLALIGGAVIHLAAPVSAQSRPTAVTSLRLYLFDIKTIVLANIEIFITFPKNEPRSSFRTSSSTRRCLARRAGASRSTFEGTEWRCGSSTMPICTGSSRNRPPSSSECDRPPIDTAEGQV